MESLLRCAALPSLFLLASCAGETLKFDVHSRTGEVVASFRSDQVREGSFHRTSIPHLTFYLKDPHLLDSARDKIDPKGSYLIISKIAERKWLIQKLTLRDGVLRGNTLRGVKVNELPKYIRPFRFFPERRGVPNPSDGSDATGDSEGHEE